MRCSSAQSPRSNFISFFHSLEKTVSGLAAKCAVCFQKKRGCFRTTFFPYGDLKPWNGMMVNCFAQGHHVLMVPFRTKKMIYR